MTVMTQLHVLALVALAGAIMLLSWRKGRDGGWLWGWPAGFLVLSPLAWLAGFGPWTAVGVAFAWALWRCSLTGETLTPVTRRALWTTVSRHSIAAALLVPLWRGWPVLVPGLLVFVVASTVLAAERAHERYVNDRDTGQQTEALQGMMFAALVIGAGFAL